MDSGLGNQMLDYAEYLAIQKSNPDGLNVIEDIIYDLPYEKGMFSQWNGYELNRIFGVQVPKLRDYLEEDAWKRCIDKLHKSHFWEENWNYAPYLTEALKEEGIVVDNLIPKVKRPEDGRTKKEKIRYLFTLFFRTRTGYHIKRYLRVLLQKQLEKNENAKFDIYQKYSDNVLIGHTLLLKYKGFGIEKIDAEIRKSFQFPGFTDEKNKKMAQFLQSVNSVAIHARRSDMLFVNGYCYKYGFFKRAVKYIKKKVENPVFVFFCDEKSTGWCQDNEKIFGLNFKKDNVYFVDWNSGEESYRDMQLMAMCKHNIFTESSFGFWGAYLNNNPQKITCAPDPLILATHSF